MTSRKSSSGRPVREEVERVARQHLDEMVHVPSDVAPISLRGVARHCGVSPGTLVNYGLGEAVKRAKVKQQHQTRAHKRVQTQSLKQQEVTKLKQEVRDLRARLDAQQAATARIIERAFQLGIDLASLIPAEDARDVRRGFD